MANDTNPLVVREAVGIFVGAKALREAINDLLSSGFDRAAVGLLAGEFTVRQSLGDLYTQTNELSDTLNAPRMAFVAKESSEDLLHGGLGALSFAAVTAAGAAVVATAGVLGGGIAVAAAGVAALGAVGAVLGKLIGENDAEHLEEQVEEGHLLLFVRTDGPAQEKLATEILSKHSGFDVRIYTVPATNAE
jgi:hypothetical protein